jgi:hypothetical protein
MELSIAASLRESNNRYLRQQQRLNHWQADRRRLVTPRTPTPSAIDIISQWFEHSRPK